MATRLAWRPRRCPERQLKLPGRPLRLAVLANFDSPHAWRWIKVFIARGHEVHAISYYPPSRDLPGARLHALRPRPASTGRVPVAAPRRSGGRLPPTLLRLANAWRYRRAGLRRVVREIAPDVFQAHFVVEHGLFGATVGYHPYVINAWGSDLFQAPRTPAGAYLARQVLRRADLLSANDPGLARAAARLGMPPERIDVVRLGLDGDWLQQPPSNVNLRPDAAPPRIISYRALEPLYNVDILLRAFAAMRERHPGLELIVAGEGSQRTRLERLAGRLGLECLSINFADDDDGSKDWLRSAPGRYADVLLVGALHPRRLRQMLRGSHVYVSVPSSDSLSLSTMEAMATGAFPIVSDLPSQDGWIEHRVNGLRVPVRDVQALAESLHLALSDHDLRRGAVEPNRAKVEAEGDLEQNMLALERHFYRLAGLAAP